MTDAERMLMEDAIETAIEETKKSLVLERCVCALGITNAILVVLFAVALLM